MRVTDLEAIRIKLASPDDVKNWSYGEITKPETINYRTQKAEKDGLFDERIFGPEKDFECYCGKYRKIRYKGVVCDRCGVEVTRSSVRRERMGHIELAAPCSHIWFLRGMPSRMGMVLDVPAQSLERVIYFASYIVTSVNEEARQMALDEIEAEFKRKSKELEGDEKQQLKEMRDRERDHLNSMKRLKIMSEVDYQTLSLKYGHVFEAGTGAEVIKQIFEEVDIDKEIKDLEEEMDKASAPNRRKMFSRLRTLRGMSHGKVRPEWMFLSSLPVLPADLRPMVQLDGGRYASSDLNDLYRRVINRNNRLKHLLELKAPEVIVRNEKRMLQESVDALIDNSMRKGTTTQSTTGGRRLLKSLADMLKGKQGRFRQNLLGKRVDYSGRSVIVSGPRLKLHQCGLPKRMALELFKPFVINKILDQELAYNVRSATRLIEQETDEVWAILEDVVKDKVVLLNRAPTLHRLGIQAFYPQLTEGETIQLHPLVCAAFNADFDGDQMAVHVPLSDEAQKEARERMLSSTNMLKPATGTPTVAPRQDMILGIYYLTGMEDEDRKSEELRMFGSSDEVYMAENAGIITLREKVKVMHKGEVLETTLGRIIFNEALPEDFDFVNDQMNAKKTDVLVGNVIRNYEMDQAEVVVDNLKELGFEYATKSGVTWGMDDLIVPDEKKKLISDAEDEIEQIEQHWRNGLLSREERVSKMIEAWSRVKTTIEKLVPDTLARDASVFTIIDSGARGSWSQPVQMAGMKGLLTNPSGRIIELPVKSSFKEGFGVLEYFISTHGARKGTADTALRTSTAGYLTRRLIDVSHEVLITEEDCKEDKGILISKKEADEVGQDLALKISGRMLAKDIKGVAKKGTILDDKLVNEITENEDCQEIYVRTPLLCKTWRGVCQACYGWDLGTNEMVAMGSAVGIVAAQSIGEPGTQLTMRTFHTGGVAGGGDITQGLPRVEEIFEGRVPGGKAIVSQVAGTVEAITEDNIVQIRTTEGKKEEDKKKDDKKKTAKKDDSNLVEYEIPAQRAIWVQKGQWVEPGQQLCEGHLDLKELLKATDKEEVQKYIVQEVLRIYATQGVSIHDKHIEVITRQMFSRVRVTDSGGTRFTEGDIVDRPSFIEESEEAKAAGKDPAKGEELLLGISKVALSTGSFLSAASFQETSRVLIKASLEGKEDKLRGLKENVIIGKLIPAGTSYEEK